MKFYLYKKSLDEKFLNFSLNREFRKYIKNPNDPAAKDRWAYVLTKSNNNFIKGGNIRHNNDGSTRLRSSDEMMNDFISRSNQAKKMAAKYGVDPNIVNVIDEVKYIDQYGNLVNGHLNQPKSYTTINSNPVDMYLSNPFHKYHEDDGHLNPNLRNYKFQDPASEKAIRENRSHDTKELQRLDACADLYAIDAYNEWCKLKEMPPNFNLTTDKMIQDRNKILYKQKCGQRDKLEQAQNNPVLYRQTQKNIINSLPIDQRNLYDYQQYIKSDENNQLENTEPELYRSLNQAQKYGYKPDEFYDIIKH